MTAIACDMTAWTAEERKRHRVLLEKLAEATTAHRETEDGYEFVIDRSQLPLAELEEWIGLESRCCPFLQFGIALRLGGGEGVKPFLKAELAL